MTPTLPRPKTRFIGRTADLARLEELAAAGASLITLWGSPGVGKTRLALELCVKATEEDAKRLNWKPRGLGRSPMSKHAVGFYDMGSDDVVLAPPFPEIVVLDNVQGARAAEAVGSLVEATPNTLFLVTSRERLRVGGEIVHEVLPLGLDDDAIALFLDRACSSTSLDPEAVAALVARLEGIPLAIELAAARVDVTGLPGLAERLDRPLELLAHGARDGDPNHHTLERAIDASFELLSDAEQRALAQCSVFRGGFSLSAAEAVLDAGAASLEVLHALRDRSLLRRVEHDDGVVSLVLLESIRAYAAAALRARGDDVAVRRRHSQHYLAASTDMPNLVEAIAFALEDATPLADVADALARLDPSCLSDRLVEVLRVALARGTDADPTLRARCHRARSRAVQLRGHLAEARVELERALELASGDRPLVADISADLGVLHHQLRAMNEARAYYERALAIHDELGNDAVARGRCLGNLGAIEHDLRAYDAALALYEEALAAFRSAREGALEGIFLTNIGVLLQERGAHARARAAYRSAIDRLAEVGARRLEAIAQTNLGLLCHETGAPDEARSHHASALALLRDVVDRSAEALSVGRLAMADAALGHEAEARAALRRARRLLMLLEDPIALRVLALFQAFVDLSLGGDADVSREHVREAQAPHGGGPPLVDVSDDARTAVRLIEGVDASAVLVIGPEARWFKAPDGAAHDLGSRKLLQRLLLCLVERHRAAPGEGLPLDRLREAGWPGERALPEAASNRVHVALTELRRRGLQSCLTRKDTRYLLHPALRVELCDT